MSTFAVVNNYCACPAGTCLTTVNGVPACTTLIVCPAGQYNNGANTCVTCPTTLVDCSTCALSGGVPLCTKCVSTTFTLVPASTTAPCVCPALTYRSAVVPVSCKSCPLYALTCDTNGAATSCQPSYSIVSGLCACLATQYKLSGVCTNCPTNCTACTSATACTACTASFTVQSGKCLCPTNTYLATVNNTCTALVPAPSGYYNNG